MLVLGTASADSGGASFVRLSDRSQLRHDPGAVRSTNLNADGSVDLPACRQVFQRKDTLSYFNSEMRQCEQKYFLTI